MSSFTEFVLARRRRLAMPILTYPGAGLSGKRVGDLATDAQAQFEAVAALHRRFQTPVVLSCMDLSAEAEAFGCQAQMSDEEPPTVLGRLVSSRQQAEALAVPQPGAGRTHVYLETVQRLAQLPDRPFVFGEMIGPFSLAARLYGAGETLALTIQDPELTHLLAGKCAAFLRAYALAFKDAGADGLVVAEPTAGLISPRSMATFSSPYIKQIVAAVDDDKFTLILHNCAAKLVHLPSVLAAGVKVAHFGAPMDLAAALSQVGPDIILCGNLDPAAVFVLSNPRQVASATRNLLKAAGHYRNFVLSSGCDVPARTPLANVEAFYRAARKG
jgi:uroporphyrinogen decarboxylase